MKRNVLVIGLVAAAVLCSSPLFASGTREGEHSENALWYQAQELVRENGSVMPSQKTVVWEELSPSGDVVSQEDVSFFYSEEGGSVTSDEEATLDETFSGMRLHIDFEGDHDAYVKRNDVNDGLLWTPFDDSVSDGDVNVVNTGISELVGGTDCTVFNYTWYSDPVQYGYNFERTVNDDYVGPESKAYLQFEGKAWIDGNGVLRQLESSLNRGTMSYTQTVSYDYNGSILYPSSAVIEGSVSGGDGDFNVGSGFRAVETMNGYWVANDFVR